MVILSKVAESLKELMDEHGLNQVMLSEKLGTGRTKFSDILNAKSAPNYRTFIKLIEFFNCSADFLLGLQDDPCEDAKYKPVQPFSTQMYKILKDRHISQNTFITETGLSWSILYGWLKDRTYPSMDNLVKVAAYFDCSIDFLLGRV